MATNFGLTTTTPYTNVIQSLNYALANMTSNVQINGNVLTANTTTGQIIGGGGTISYLYGYIDVQYANTATGGGFTSNSNNTQYYGVRNVATPVEDSNPTDYSWTQVVGGFGTTKGLYYATGGGGTIEFVVGNVALNQYFSPVIDNTPILLAEISNNLVTGNSIQGNTVTGNNIQQGTITGNNIAAGTITANLIAANTVFVSQSLQSTNATLGSFSSPGFWLEANTGSARFGGNTSIGDSLTVGNNAVIGGNLTVGNNAVIGGNLVVSGLITAGQLNANTVNTSTLVAGAVITGAGDSNENVWTYYDPPSSTGPVSGNVYYYPDAVATITGITANSTQQVFVNGLVAGYIRANNTPTSFSTNQYVNYILVANYPYSTAPNGNITLQVFGETVAAYDSTGTWDGNQYFYPSFSYVDDGHAFAPRGNTAIYRVGVFISNSSVSNGINNINTISLSAGSVNAFLVKK